MKLAVVAVLVVEGVCGRFARHADAVSVTAISMSLAL